MDKAQTRKRQNRTTHINPDLRKTQSDSASDLSLQIELKNNTRKQTKNITEERS